MCGPKRRHHAAPAIQLGAMFSSAGAKLRLGLRFADAAAHIYANFPRSELSTTEPASCKQVALRLT
jgi:hypothetical protein